MTMRGAGAIVAAGALAAVAGATSVPAAAPQAAAADGTSISGVVRSAAGPEAGVWVIAETDDLETGFRKIVVTGDDGRFLIPELATATYDVWVRGYGLADSERRTARPGDTLELTVSAAASPQEAASVYPANYWYSLIEVPPPADFPGTGDNGINPAMRTQEHFIDGLKDGCQLCHQLGNEATREMPMVDLDEFDSTADAWAFRLGTGATGSSMIRQVNEMGRQRTLDVYADWTDRILAGEVPAAPPRPSGVERNLVLTMWKWSSPQKHVHDNIATDKRNPRLNANGPVYGILGDNFVAVDPATHRAREWVLPTRDAMGASGRVLPSLYWDAAPGYGAASGHNPMMDADGRVWLTSAIRPAGNPEWCRDGSHPSSAYFPVERSTRQVSYYDPEADEFVFIDSCYTTHHLQFAEDAEDTLWFSGDVDVVGWLNTRLYDRTGDEQAAQGWCPTVIDTNGDGAITKPWNEPGEAVDAARDTRLDGFAYGIIPNPADGSIWITRGSMSGPATEFPGSILRLDPGESPPRDLHRRGLRAAVRESGRRPRGLGLRAARDRRRSRRGALDGAQRERAPGELRPPQVRNPERTRGHRPALPGGLDAPLHPGSPDAGGGGVGQRGFPLLQLGRSVRHARPRRERADGERQRLRLAAGAAPADRRVGRHARSVPPRVLHARPQRAHRRPRGRLEGPRPLGQLRHHGELAQRGRQGEDERDRPLPDPPAPTREVA